MTVIIFYVNCLVMCGVTRKKDWMKWPRAYTDEHGSSFLWQGGNCLQQLALREKKAESSHLRGVILGYSQFTSTAMLFNSQLVGLPLDRKIRTGLICFYQLFPSSEKPLSWGINLSWITARVTPHSMITQWQTHYSKESVQPYKFRKKR